MKRGGLGHPQVEKKGFIVDKGEYIQKHLGESRLNQSLRGESRAQESGRGESNGRRGPREGGLRTGKGAERVTGSLHREEKPLGWRQLG